MNILIVEDDDNIANVVSEILQAREFETVLCDTGSQAVELIKNNMYDLILLDVMLPGLDGFQVMQKIAYRRIPVRQWQYGWPHRHRWRQSSGVRRE